MLIAEKLNYFMTLLRGKNEAEVKFENSKKNKKLKQKKRNIDHWKM